MHNEDCFNSDGYDKTAGQLLDSVTLVESEKSRQIEIIMKRGMVELMDYLALYDAFNLYLLKTGRL